MPGMFVTMSSTVLEGSVGRFATKDKTSALERDLSTPGEIEGRQGAAGAQHGLGAFVRDDGGGTEIQAGERPGAWGLCFHLQSCIRYVGLVQFQFLRLRQRQASQSSRTCP